MGVKGGIVLVCLLLLFLFLGFACHSYLVLCFFFLSFFTEKSCLTKKSALKVSSCQNKIIMKQNYNSNII